jgi:ABC-type molybdate transport system substrate-binding protein
LPIPALESSHIFIDERRQLGGTSAAFAPLAAVESGNVDAELVYKTDANISSKVRIG